MKTLPLKQRAFSLLELLIVMAIISILSALLFPVIQNAIVKGQCVAVGNDGKQVWMALFDDNISRQRRGLPDVWPTSADYATSTEFYQDCIEKQWLGDDYTFAFLGAPGLEKAFSVDPAEFAADNNAWCVVVDAGYGTQQETPFMFTRNFVTAASGGGTIDAIAGLNPDEKPFGDRAGVVVTFGGAVKVISKKDIGPDFQKIFNPYGETLAYVTP